MDESYFDNGNPLQNTTFLFQKKKKSANYKEQFFLKSAHITALLLCIM